MLKRTRLSPIARRLLSWKLVVSFVVLSTGSTSAQTPQVAYQGKLSDGGSLANGGYDFQFKLFDTATLGTGTQQGSPQTLTNITVTNGIFSVLLDFGSCGTCFNGAYRFLEIAVKLTSGSTFTTLGPRQQITSTPYALKSLSSGVADGLSLSCVNCVTSSQIASVNGSAIVGTIPPASLPPGSGSYIQNTTSQQAASNFNISGNGALGGSLGIGTASSVTRLESVDPATQFRFGPTPADNGGYLISTTPSQANIAGGARWSGSQWVAKSTEASLIGQVNGATQFFANTGLTPGAAFSPTERMIITTSGNVGIGISSPAGLLHVKGTSPVRILGDPSTLSGSEFVDFMARSSIFSSDLGGMRIQRQAGTGNIDISIFAAPNAGSASEKMRVTGNGNVGIGTITPAVRLDVNGSLSANSGATITGTNGDGAVVTARRSGGDPYIIIDAAAVSQNSVLAYRKNNLNRWLMYADNSSESRGNAGSNFRIDAYNDAGFGIATSLFVQRATGNVGIGTTTPDFKLDVGDRMRVRSGAFGSAGIWFNEFPAGDRGFVGMKDTTYVGFYGAAGGFGLLVDTSNGEVTLPKVFGSGGASVTPLCRVDFDGRVSFCSSSLRYKTALLPFAGGLDVINRLKPITFAWKQDGKRDVGLGAEDVEKVEPLLTFRNDKGEIEGVKYDRLSVVFINAFKEQQAQIESQQAQIRGRERQASVQQTQIEQYRKQLAAEQGRNYQQQTQLTNLQIEIEALKRLVCATHPRTAVCKAMRRTS